MNRALVLARFARQRQNVVPRRNMSDGYIGYRQLNYEPSRKIQKPIAELMTGVFWWWVGWNLMTDWHHLVGEHILANNVGMDGRRTWYSGR